jgi:outer membrane protein, heavy metal efflux system
MKPQPDSHLIQRSCLCLLALAVTQFCVAAAANPIEGLTLDQAIERAERRQPQLAEARALIEAAAGRAEQAGALPNPELILGAQQLPLDRGASNQREYVAGVAQPIPVGGRLRKAREAELMEQEVRLRGLEVARRDLRRGVHAAFATALYQEQAFEAQSQIAQGLEKLVTATTARIDAGDAVAEDLARVEIEMLRAEVERQRSQALRDQSLLALAVAMGDANLQIVSLAGDLEATFEVPMLETLAASLVSQPEVLQAEANLQASSAWLELVRSERIPDVRVEALYHRLEATEENTIDLGISIPLPLFNRNQGRLREARAESEAAQARARLTRNEVAARLQISYVQLTSALSSSRTLRGEVLPRAEKVLHSAEARYEVGDISLIELLPVRRNWAEVRLGCLESLRDVLLAWTDVRSFGEL